MKKKISIAAVPDLGGGPWRYERCKPWFPPNVNFKVISIPGFGGQPSDDHFNSADVFADHIKAQLQNMAKPLFLFGTGVGGSLALQLIQDPKSRPYGTILHAPMGPKVVPQFYPEWMKRSWSRRIVLNAMAINTFRDHLRKKLFRQPIPDAFARQFFEEYRNCEAYDQIFRIINPQWFYKLDPISKPSVILWGGNEAKPTQERIDAFKSVLPDAKVKFVKEWDYFPMIEQPRSFALELTSITQEMLAAEKQKESKAKSSSA